MLLIPAIDLRNGRCVRLLKGDFAAETRYEFEPHELLQRYREIGATWLHVVDLDGARAGTLTNRSIVVSLASQTAVKIQVGGGVRSTAVIDDLLRNGVSRVVIGSLAIEQPQQVLKWLDQFGAARVCLAFDIRNDEAGVPRVRTRGWTEGGHLSLWQALEPYLPHGLQHVLCTDIDRDGALSGPSLELYREAVQRHPQIAWQASGGVRDAADLAALAQLGLAAAVSGKALLEERMTLEELRPFLPNA